MVSTEMWIFIGMVVVGFSFLLMAFLGGGDHDVAADVGGDVLAGVESPGLSPVSMPIIATFLVTAGATGAALTTGGTDTLTTMAIAVGVGSLVSLGGFVFVAKFLAEGQSSSLIHEKEYEGKTGVVTETIPEEGVGAIAVTVRGTRYVVSARSPGRKIPMGAEVLVKHVANSIASVEELKSV